MKHGHINATAITGLKEVPGTVTWVLIEVIDPNLLERDSSGEPAVSAPGR
jgi:hypothetical protein